MKKPTMTYDQLRRILALAVETGSVKVKLEQLLDGGVLDMNELEFVKLVKDSEIDLELIRILSGEEAEKMDAMEALEYISAFFGYIRANKERFRGWLASIGLNAPKLEKKPA